MRAALLALPILAALAAPAAAQPPTQVVFAEDSKGYARALMKDLMADTFRMLEEEGIPTRLSVAQISLNNDRQPEFAVRMENSRYCDRHGCMVSVFMLVNRSWTQVLETKTVNLWVGAPDPQSGMAALFTDGQSEWTWDGERYDVVAE